MNIENISLLLEEFNKLPKKRKEPTFLEICSYPQRRFEEICSRILSFYFNPRREHKLKDLFISSLFELLNRKDIEYQIELIKIKTEDNADGKRIDLVIYCPDFIVGIENKITASLYNPLETYEKRLKEYSINNTFKLILSLQRIKKMEELELMNKNGFLSITYSELFEVVKRNIGYFIADCNQKYLTQLYDFIQTLENMKSANRIDMKISKFFFENSTQIDELINTYNSYYDSVLNMQKERIAELRIKISTLTGKEWWAYQGWDLGFNSFNPNKPKIGIESSYKVTKESALGEFRIYITTWNLSDWGPYDKILTDRFPDKFLDKSDRVYLHMDVISGDDEDLILKKLNEYFSLLTEITK